ncbi:MAG: hypothetical protein GAK30_03304 [Paracidovorax wautersii]|uniref:Sulphur transport domain-containing protein n=1 Tax=Paracidovorax wautersii TaxID=1177982 RepID=A0A7V8FLF4_9BURK|nr:MAG: hypothetical protein GAK30_03304 [Paracidovorax wautersii]
MRLLSPLSAAVLALLLIASSQVLAALPQGATLVFALWLGAALGFVFQRSRFCFYCHARDWFEARDARGLLAIIAAIAVGLLGYTVVLGSWMPVPAPGRLPPDIHIGPVSWVLATAGLAFGLGMVVSGSCISAHWYRLAEGSAASPFALIGTAVGFGLGFLSWNPLYSAAVADAPVIWLPAHLGYGGALALQLAVLGALALWLWRRAAPGTTAAPATDEADGAPARSLRALWRPVFNGRWPYWIGGVAVGVIGFLAIIRMRPLGVTTTLGSGTRRFSGEHGWIPERLDGLDGFAGCATAPSDQWLTPHAALLGGLLAGGVLLGWGAMTGLGCSIGTLLSGSMAGALSGWVFGAAMFAAVGVGLTVQRHVVGVLGKGR